MIFINKSSHCPLADPNNIIIAYEVFHKQNKSTRVVRVAQNTRSVLVCLTLEAIYLQKSVVVDKCGSFIEIVCLRVTPVQRC